VKMDKQRATGADTRKRLGAKGEGEAVEYLRGAGYRIVERNFRSRSGEIDIIAEKDGTLAFLEVKTWSVYPESELEYSIDSRKQRRIMETARFFLMKKTMHADKKIRFDVILMPCGGSPTGVRHIENAFNGAVG
jgi:putative endonuclease